MATNDVFNKPLTLVFFSSATSPSRIPATCHNTQEYTWASNHTSKHQQFSSKYACLLANFSTASYFYFPQVWDLSAKVHAAFSPPTAHSDSHRGQTLQVPAPWMHQAVLSAVQPTVTLQVLQPWQPCTESLWKTIPSMHYLYPNVSKPWTFNSN